jgi:NTP pyrophosphatase (non-canonical NTP hydrolase)
MDNLGLSWTTPQGYEFKITRENIPWIEHNAKTSMFNDNRSYIYNKAFYEAFFNPKHKQTVLKYDTSVDKIPNRFDLIRQWADKRGIYDSGDSKTQYVKLMEEAGELAKALLNRDIPEVVDAIGDMVVVLTNLARLENFNIEDCIDSAYNEIANRKGEMINGTFVKETI